MKEIADKKGRLAVTVFFLFFFSQIWFGKTAAKDKNRFHGAQQDTAAR